MTEEIHRGEQTGNCGADLAEGSLKSDSEEILSFLRNDRGSIALRGTQQAALSYLLTRGTASFRKPLVLVTPTDREAERSVEELSFFWGKNNHRPDSPLDRRIWYFPSRTGHKAQLLGKTEATARRIETLYAIRSVHEPIIVVASALAMIERLPPPAAILENSEYRVAGEEVDLDGLARRLVERGYYRVSLVEESGDMSLRGGVLDVFAPLYKWPLRLEFFGDQIESIRLFNPVTQRSMGTLEDALILPASEIILDGAARELAEKAVYDDVQHENLTPGRRKRLARKIPGRPPPAGLRGGLSYLFQRTVHFVRLPRSPYRTGLVRHAGSLQRDGFPLSAGRPGLGGESLSERMEKTPVGTPGIP